MNNRLKAARKALHLTQREFGERIGVQDTAISKIEGGANNLTDQMILAICRAFSINEEWLRSGKGEMFVENDDTLLAELVNEYGLDGVDAKILDTYIRMYNRLPEETHRAVKYFLRALADAVSEGTTSLDDFMGGENEAVRVFKAAHSVENKDTEITSVPRSTIEKLKAAKPADEI